MRIHVVGLGAVGCLVSQYLRRTIPQEHTVTLLHQSWERAQKAKLAGDKIQLHSSRVQITAEGFQNESIGTGIGEQKGQIPIYSLIVCTKAHQTHLALKSLQHRLSANSTIVLLQNGMGVYEHLVKTLFPQPETRPHFVFATNTHGVHFKRYLSVIHAGVGDINLGIAPDPQGKDFEQSSPHLNLDDIAEPHAVAQTNRYASLRYTMATLMSVAPLNVHWRPIRELRRLMRRKVVVNSVINPLTALMSCPNGALFEHPEARTLARAVCYEAEGVFRKQHSAELAGSARHVGESSFKPFPETLTTMQLVDECARVAWLTKNNFSSMLMDVQKEKETEIDFMNGWFVQMGKDLHLPVQTNSTIVNLIKLRGKIPFTKTHPVLKW